VNIIDPVSVARIDAAFAADIAEARLLTFDDVNQKPGWFSRIVEEYFFSQLIFR
jgi:hypothetical protein